MEAIKEYLVQYCEGRKQDGYTMQRDPLLNFYETLCVGLTNGTDDFFQPSPADNSGTLPIVLLICMACDYQALGCQLCSNAIFSFVEMFRTCSRSF